MQEKKEKNPGHWKRVFIDRVALAKYTKDPERVKKLARALVESPGSTDWEPLSRELASARLNDADRALIIDFEVDGERTAVIADIAENHDYNKSPLYSDKDGVAKYRAKYGPSIIQRIREQMAEEQAAAARQAAGDAVAPPHPVITLDCYNQNFIRLNTQQESVLETRLPALISGAPGSGKSCVAISLITELVSRLSDNPETCILYVTKSPELIKAMQAIWDALLLPEELKQRVEFKTYETVAREQKGEAFVGKTIAKEADFEEWLKGYMPARLPEARQLYEEFRLSSGYPDKTQYLGLGDKKSLYHNKADKQWILKAYKAYLAYLEDKRKVAPDFLDLGQQEKYDLVLSDEAQDLSGQELLNLLNLAKNGQICLCMDSHQSLFDSKSKRPFIFELMQRSGLELKYIELPHSYRCPAHVVHFANTVIGIKNQAVGGSSDKLERPEIKMSPEQANTPGMVHWLKQDEEELAKLRDMAGQSNFAIITLPQYVDEARKKYPKAVMIYTPEQIKGLEYENVILYRMLDDPLCHEASRELNLELNGKIPVNQPKRGCSRDRFGPPFNKIFTSCTRATRRLFVDQGKGHPLTNLCNALEQGIKTPDTAFLREVILKQTEEEYLAGWQAETCRLYQNGKKEMAEEAFNHWNREKMLYVNYESFLLAHELIKIEEPAKPTETAPVQEPEKRLAATSEVSEKKDSPIVSNTASENRPSDRGKRGRQRRKPNAETPTTASLSKNTFSGGVVGRSPKFFSSSPKKVQEELPDSTRFEESVQSNLNDWFEGFSDSWFDLISDKPQPEYLFELLFVIKHAGYDCFLSRLKSDNERWMALKRSFTKYPEMTAFYFSLSQLSKEKSGSGKTYFEILCRKQYGLDFLKEVWESMSIPGMLDKDPLPSLPAILFGASSDTEWGKLSEENNLLMYLLNHPTGRHIFKTLFTSQLFSSLSSKDKDGETLLHWAVRNQRINVIVLIMAARDSALREGLLRGEDDVLGVKNKAGLTPLELAQADNLGNVIKSLDPALYQRSAVKKAETSSQVETFENKESLDKKIVELEKTRGAMLLPEVKKLCNEIEALYKSQKSIEEKIEAEKATTQKGLSNKKALTRQLNKTKRSIADKHKMFDRQTREARLNALADLASTPMDAKETYEKFDLLIIGSGIGLMYCILISMPTPNGLTMLRCMYKNKLKASDRGSTWSCLENYLQDNKALVHHYFSLDELFKPFEDSDKTRFEMLARTEEGLEFLVLVFKSLNLSDTMKFEAQASIGLSLFVKGSIKGWGAVRESNSLFFYLLNRPQGLYLLSRLPATIVYNLMRRQDSELNSVLHWAVSSKRAELIAMVLALEPRLKDSGAIRALSGLKNTAGQTALDIAKATEFEDGIALLTALESNQTVQPGLAAYSSLYHPAERASTETESSACSTLSASIGDPIDSPCRMP